MCRADVLEAHAVVCGEVVAVALPLGRPVQAVRRLLSSCQPNIQVDIG